MSFKPDRRFQLSKKLLGRDKREIIGCETARQIPVLRKCRAGILDCSEKYRYMKGDKSIIQSFSMKDAMKDAIVTQNRNVSAKANDWLDRLSQRPVTWN